MLLLVYQTATDLFALLAQGSLPRPGIGAFLLPRSRTSCPGLTLVGDSELRSGHWLTNTVVQTLQCQSLKVSP